MSSEKELRVLDQETFVATAMDIAYQRDELYNAISAFRDVFYDEASSNDDIEDAANRLIDTFEEFEGDYE